MNKAITAIVTATVTVAFLALALPAISQAQNVNDHLKCYKIKDSHRYSAVADLITNSDQSMYPSEAGCRILVKSKEFCLPINKDRILQPNNKRDAPHEDVVGQDLTNDFLCYKVRCPTDPTGAMPPSVQDVVDQFGQREISGFRTTKMCTPAWKVFDQPVPCEQSGAPTCNGDCPNPTDVCTNIAGTLACRCEPEQSDPCELSGAPTCGGDCADASKQCTFVGDPVAAFCVCQ